MTDLFFTVILFETSIFNPFIKNRKYACCFIFQVDDYYNHLFEYIKYNCYSYY